MSLQAQLEQQAIPKFRGRYVRYLDLEKASRESLVETRVLGAGATVKYLHMCASARVKKRARNNRAAEAASWAALSLPPASQFAKSLESELARVVGYAETFAEEMWVALGRIVDSLERGTAPSGSTSDQASGSWLADLAQQADEIGYDIVLLDDFLRQNVVAAAHLAQQHDRMAAEDVPHGRPASQWKDSPYLNPAYVQAMEQFLMTSLEYDTIFVHLSEAYRRIRQIKQGSSCVMLGVLDDDRVKIVKKFWVHPGDVLKLKSCIVKHLPVAVPERESERRGGRKRLSFFKDDWVDDWTCINRVYFDDQTLNRYHEQLGDGTDVSVVVAEWKGWRNVGPDQEIGLEVKTSERHADEEEQATLRKYEMAEYLKGSHSFETDAKGMELLLLRSIQDRLTSRDESPAVRIDFRRTEFGNGHPFGMQACLDTHVRFVKERGFVPLERGEWCRDVRLKMNEKDVVRFPYAILELMIDETTVLPDWAQDVLDLGILVEVPSFCKYLHGCALLLGDELQKFPHWFVEDAEGKHRPCSLEELEPLPVILPNTDPCPSSSRLVPIPEESRGLLSVGTRSREIRSAGLSERSMTDQRPQQQQQQQSTSCLSRENSTGLSEVVVIPSQSKSAKSLKGRKWTSQKVVAQDPDPASKQKPKQNTLLTTQIEPKTFFANERTFLAWMMMSVLVMFMGLSLMAEEGFKSLARGTTGGASGRTSCSMWEYQSCSASKISGMLVTPVAILMILYALAMYYKRTNQLLRKETSHYDEPKGPVLLTVLLIAVLTVAYVISIRHAFSKQIGQHRLML